MDRFTDFITRRRNLVISSIVFGAGYFVVLLRFILDYTYSKPGGALLGFFFAPAIICGMAYVFIRGINMLKEAGNSRAVLFITLVNVIILIIAVLFAVDMIIN